MEPDDAMLALTLRSTECYRTVPSAIAIVFHTFEELESQVISVMSVILPPVYAIGPLPLLLREAGAGAGGDHAATTSAVPAFPRRTARAWTGSTASVPTRWCSRASGA